jgi:hypothetical protein
MKYPAATARHFNTDRKNKRKSLFFNLAVGLVLVLVAVGTLAPTLVKGFLALQEGFDNLKTNLTGVEKETLNPIAQTFTDRVLGKLDPSIFQVKEIKELDPYSVELYSSQEVVAVMTSKEDLDKQVSSLQGLLVKSRIESKPIKRIDLRFSKTVVEYKN